jgi:hydrogenase/urease accessory protein HupE
MRRVSIGLSLVTLGVGIWLLTRVHDVTAVCSGTVSLTTGQGLNPDCMNMAAVYFLGFALTIFSLVILAIALVSMAKKERYDRRRIRRRAITTLQRRESERLRDVA